MKVYSSETYKTGYIANNVPSGLQKIVSLLGNTTLLQSTAGPGVYVIYLEDQNKIYVGQSKNVSQEISQFKGKSRTNTVLKDALQGKLGKVYYCCIYSGPSLESKVVRFNLETQVLQRLHSFCLNKQLPTSIKSPVNKGPISIPNSLATPSLSNSLTLKSLKTQIITGSLAPYGIPYTGLPIQLGKPCIYLLYHPTNKKVYVGQTKSLNTYTLLKRHKTNLYEISRRSFIDSSYLNLYAPLAMDYAKKPSFLALSILEYLPTTIQKTLLNREDFYKSECFKNKNITLLNPKLASAIKPGGNQTACSARRISESLKGRPVVQDLYPAACIVNGVWYDTYADAAKALGFKSSKSVSNKCKNSSYTNWISLKDLGNKTIPQDLVFIKKYEEYKKKRLLSSKNVRRIWNPS